MPLIKNNTSVSIPIASYGYNPVSLAPITITNNDMSSISDTEFDCYGETTFTINVRGNVRFSMSNSNGIMYRIDNGEGDGINNYTDSFTWEGNVVQNVIIKAYTGKTTIHYFDSVSGTTGLMSGEDKEKLDNLHSDYYEWSNYIHNTLRDKGIIE